MKIIQHCKHEEEVEYFRSFVRNDDAGAGFSFPCDKDGKVEGHQHFAAAKNYRKCLDGTFDVLDCGIKRIVHRYTLPAIGECDDCGAHVDLDCFTNTCEKCGADYNLSGQRLAPRSQWGEETGERF